MSFTFDTSTNVGKVRREIGDRENASLTPGAGIRPNGENYTDEDIEYYLAQNQDNVDLSAISILTILATEFSTKGTEAEMGSVRESYKSTVVNIRRQIATIQARYDAGKKTSTSKQPSTNQRITWLF